MSWFFLDAIYRGLRERDTYSRSIEKCHGSQIGTEALYRTNTVKIIPFTQNEQKSTKPEKNGFKCTNLCELSTKPQNKISFWNKTKWMHRTRIFLSIFLPFPVTCEVRELYCIWLNLWNITINWCELEIEKHLKIFLNLHSFSFITYTFTFLSKVTLLS